MDAGTFDSLLDVGNSIRNVRMESDINVGCPEEAALKKGFVTKEDVLKHIGRFKENDYREYVENISEKY